MCGLFRKPQKSQIPTPTRHRCRHRHRHRHAHRVSRMLDAHVWCWVQVGSDGGAGFPVQPQRVRPGLCHHAQLGGQLAGEPHASFHPPFCTMYSPTFSKSPPALQQHMQDCTLDLRFSLTERQRHCGSKAHPMHTAADMSLNAQVSGALSMHIGPGRSFHPIVHV